MSTRYPIVALWAHPRSMSTAFERIMRERGDCTVFHEPFLEYYYRHRAGRTLPLHDWAAASLPDSYGAVRDALVRAGDDRPVFFKDMSYYVAPEIFSDGDFAQRLVNLFLIRDPRRAIASYYRLDPRVSLAEIGLEAQWLHFSSLCDRIGQAPLVVQAEDLQADPRGMMARVWRRAGLGFADHAFEWKAEEVPDDWKRVAGWHEGVVASTGIAAGKASSRQDAQQAFDAVATAAPHLRDYLAHHAPFYQKLKHAAVQSRETGAGREAPSGINGN